MFDENKVRDAVKLLLEGIGEDPNRDGLKDTPDRVMRMYKETLGGYYEDPEQHLRVFDDPTQNMVIVKDIPFFSYCEHHLAPFIGKLHIGYVPNGKVIGISKLVRLARVFAKRLQIQERLTDQIADLLEKTLKPLGVMVYLEAEHTCMALRGVRTPGAKTVTSAVRGCFRDKTEQARSEFMEGIRR